MNTPHYPAFLTVIHILTHIIATKEAYAPCRSLSLSDLQCLLARTHTHTCVMVVMLRPP
jgi:hypothetical protein